MASRRGLIGGEPFEGFYARHADSLVVWFVRRTLDAETAVDLAAETFAQAYLARRRFRGQTQREAAAWLYSIARHQLGRYHRKGRAEQRALRRLGADLPLLKPTEIERIEELGELKSARMSLQAGIDRLTEGQRQAIGLRVIDELPYEEVARRLGTSEQTARARVSRGLRAMEEFLTADISTAEEVAK